MQYVKRKNNIKKQEVAIQLFWVVLGGGQQYPVCLMLITKYTERFTEIPTLWSNREVAMPTSAADGSL